MIVIMPSSLVTVNRGRRWQIVTAVLSNIRYQAYLFMYECVWERQGVIMLSHISFKHPINLFSSPLHQTVVVSVQAISGGQ